MFVRFDQSCFLFMIKEEAKSISHNMSAIGIWRNKARERERERERESETETDGRSPL